MESSANSRNTKGFGEVQWNEKDESTIIGEGSFGVVYSGFIPERHGRNTHRKKTHVAVKVLRHGPVTCEEQRDFMREIETSRKFSHPALTNFICYSMGVSYRIVTELCKTDLNKALQLSYAMSWTNEDGATVEWNDTKKAICAAGVAIGLHVIHASNVIHRDLKTDNIMLDENMWPKISDFGLSRTIPYGADASRDMIEMTRNRGTPLYMAPEMFDETFGGYNQKIDVYAYAMFLYELATGSKPFKERNELNKFKLALYISNGQRPTIPSYVNPMWADIMKQCWEQSPAARPTMKQVVDMIVNNQADFLDGEVTKNADENEFADYIDMAMAAINQA